MEFISHTLQSSRSTSTKHCLCSPRDSEFSPPMWSVKRWELFECLLGLQGSSYGCGIGVKPHKCAVTNGFQKQRFFPAITIPTFFKVQQKVTEQLLLGLKKTARSISKMRILSIVLLTKDPHLILQVRNQDPKRVIEMCVSSSCSGWSVQSPNYYTTTKSSRPSEKDILLLIACKCGYLYHSPLNSRFHSDCPKETCFQKKKKITLFLL